MRSTVHFVDRLEKQVPNASFFGPYLPVLGKNIWLSALLVLFGQLATAQVAPCFVTNTNAPSISVSGTQVRQSFVATCTGQITSFVFKFQAATAPITLKVFQGGDCSTTPPTGFMTEPTQVFTASVSGALTTVNLTTPIPVTNGTAYVIQLSSASGFRVYFNGTANPYAGGRMIWGATCPSNSPYGPSSDLYFRANIGASTVVNPEIDVRGGTPELSIVDGDATPSTADSTDFGTTVFGSSIDHIFRVFNTAASGSPDLVINTGGITLTGTHPGDFTLLDAPVLPIPPGGVDTIIVRFSPLAIGLRRAILTIPNNDPDENPYNFDIQGRFNCPEILANITGNVLICPGGSTGVLPIDVYSSEPWPPFTVKLSDGSVHTVNELGVDSLHVTVSPTLRPFTIAAVTDRFGCVGTATGLGEVIVRDIEVPIITFCPASPDPVPAVSGQCYASVNLGTATATDNCATPVVTNDAPLNGQFPVGTTVVTWTAMDPSSNAATCSQTVTVYATADPSITCPPDQTINTDEDCNVLLPDFRDLATASDVCSLSLDQFIDCNFARTMIECDTIRPGDPLEGVGIWAVTMVASNGSTSAACSFFLTIEDHSVPTITCPPSVTLSTNEYYVLETRAGSDKFGAKGTASRVMAPSCGYDPQYCLDYPEECDDSFLPTVEDNCLLYVNLIYELSGASTDIGNDYDFVDNAFFYNGTTTVTWTATDPGGNTASCSYSVTVVDSTAPFIACSPLPQIRSVCSVYTAAGAEFDAEYEDNCGVSSLVYSLSGATISTGNNTLAGVMFQQGTTNVLWTVTDNAGLTATCSFAVMVGDTMPPTIDCSAISTLLSTDMGLCTVDASAYPATATAVDNCLFTVDYVLTGATTGSFSDANTLGVLNSGETVATFTAVDAAGYTATCSVTIVVEDNESPVITTCPTGGPVTGPCEFTILDATYDPVFTDNCGASATYVLSGATSGSGIGSLSGVTLNPGTSGTTVTWTVTDGNGNSSNCSSFIITVTGDVTPPVWTEGATDLDRTVDCSDAAGLAAAQALAPTATDDCAVNLATLAKLSGTFVAGLCPQSGTYTNTWTVQDSSGNTSSTYTQVITITDTNAPAWTTPYGALDRTVECGDALALGVAQGLVPTFSDCDLMADMDTVELPIVSGNCSNLLTGTIVRNFFVTDACGNTSTNFTQVITIVDTTAPTWVDAPGDLDMTLSCSDAAGLASAQMLEPVPQDNCSMSNFTIQKVSGVFVAGACPNAGTYTNTFVALDECGNSSTAYTQVITVYDIDVPTWVTANGALDRTVACSDAASLVSAQALRPVASDNCDLSVAITKQAGVRVGAGAVCGTITNTFTATDDCGNAGLTVFTQVITIVDNVLPIIICPANTTVALSANCTATLAAYTASASDNCGTPSVVQSPAAGTALLNGVPTTVTMTATDGCANTSACSFTVTAIDNTPPTISCPTSVPAITMVSCSAPLPAYSATSVTDNCTANPVVTQSPAAGNAVTTAGTTVVTLTATDGAGLTRSCTIAVLVRTGVTPSISCPANKTVNLNASCQFTFPNYTSEGIVTYPCPGAVVTQNIAVGTVLSGVTTRTVILTATTPEGTPTCSFTVTTKDITPPTVTCPGTQTLEMGTNCRAVMPDYRGLATWADNCTASGSILKQQLSPYTPGTVVAGLGPITVTLRARDASSNTNNCTFTVNRVDNTAPFCSSDAGNGAEDRDNLDATATAMFDFDLSPNPATDHVNLSLYGLQGTALVSIVDQLGRTVWEQSIETEQTNLQVNLGADRFDSGLYLVTVRSDGSMLTKRLILTK